MHLIKWILAIVVVVAGLVLFNHPLFKIKMAYGNYQAAPGVMAQDRVIKKSKKVMRPSSLPFILEIYSSNRDIKFAESMIGSCRGVEANNKLWDISHQEGVDPLVRTICFAHLLSRGQLDVWRAITDADIETICNSPPHHIVFWKTLLLRNTGYTHSVFKGDVHPERTRFRDLFHECIEMQEQREFLLEMRRKE